MKHARRPSHVGDPSIHANVGTCRNPLCGDVVEVGVSLQDGLVSGIDIRASGCAISMASASLMTEVVEGLSVSSALGALDQFNASLLAPVSAVWPEEILVLKPFARLRESPTRVPCALIGWFALKDALVGTTSSD